jgi:hypothetical protein
MAIDFLGKPKQEHKKVGPDVEYHIPEKDKIQKETPVKKEVVKELEPPKPKEELGEVNLMTAFKKYLRRRKEIIAVICIVVLLAMIIGGYFLYNYIVNLPPPPVIKYSCNTNSGQCSVDANGSDTSLSVCQSKCFAPKPQSICGNGICEINETTANCSQDCPPPAPKYSCNTNSGQCFNDVNGVFANFNDCQNNCFAPPPSPVCGNGICENNENTANCSTDCPPIILPDTQLSPLRGALVRFVNDSNIYLIEYNGELRKIDAATVRFKNGQSVNQLNPKLIYTLAISFEDTRKGKDVKGFIDWDPRVLTEEELAPFIK